MIEEDEWLANDPGEKSTRAIDAVATTLKIPEAAELKGLELMICRLLAQF